MTDHHLVALTQRIPIGATDTRSIESDPQLSWARIRYCYGLQIEISLPVRDDRSAFNLSHYPAL